jgi:hypothetical protein
MGKACSISVGIKENECKILVRNTEGKRPTGRIMDNIEIKSDRMGWYGRD